MLTIKEYQSLFLNHLTTHINIKEPLGLYAPVHYILEMGGKRLRPVFTLMIGDIFGTDPNRALHAALAVETFHNFTLMHDDIMDNASLRRGQDTVHKKWNINTGILSGDAMLITAYQFLESYPAAMYKELSTLFNRTAIQVCEGQQYDLDFETRKMVSIPEYLKMIEYKTAVLIAAAMKMGAIIADAPTESAEAIYDFGRYLGIAFQLKDDYLDTFGCAETFGKQIGGDIIAGKKTFLFLKAIETLQPKAAEQLQNHYSIASETINSNKKIADVKALFIAGKADVYALEEIEKYTEKALQLLDRLDISKEDKNALQHFAESLMERSV